MNIKVNTLAELLKLRQQLTKVSDLSFRYNEIKKRYPIDNIDEETAQEVILACREILDEYEGGQDGNI